MKNEVGSSAAINPKTGETLALVSTPAYNPNTLTRGASKAQRDAVNNDPKTDDESIYTIISSRFCI